MKTFYIQAASDEISNRIETTGNWEVSKEEIEPFSQENGSIMKASTAGEALYKFASELEEEILSNGVEDPYTGAGIYHIWSEDWELIATGEVARQNLFQVYIGTDSRIWK